MPAKSSLTELLRPPRLEINSTPRDIAKAPIKAAMPTKFSPSATPIPSRIAAVAPSEAPEEIPSIYGSANGFFTTACMITPQTESPMPTKAANTRRGKRSSQTISCTGPRSTPSMGCPLNSCSTTVL